LPAPFVAVARGPVKASGRRGLGAAFTGRGAAKNEVFYFLTLVLRCDSIKFR